MGRKTCTIRAESIALCAHATSVANKKAGEYSEEDTHRPAYYRLKVAASQAFGKATGQSVTHSLEKETR